MFEPSGKSSVTTESPGIDCDRIVWTPPTPGERRLDPVRDLRLDELGRQPWRLGLDRHQAWRELREDVEVGSRERE